MNHNDKLPEITRKRLVELRNQLNFWEDSRITSKEISNITGWKDNLVRHDLYLLKRLQEETNPNGNTKLVGLKNGFDVKELQSLLSSPLLSNSEHANGLNICIVGLGRLGAALLDENLLLGTDFHIKAGFDSNINRVEILRSTFPLYPAVEMGYIIKRENIEFAILTVSDNLALQMSEKLIKSGIKGIINMTNVILPQSDNVKIQNLSIKNALQLVL